MKKLMLLCLAFLITNFLYSQDFTGKALFNSSFAMKVSFGTPEKSDSITTGKKTTMPVAQQEDLNKQIRTSMQKEYELVFNKSESLYKEIPKLKGVNEEKGIEVVGLGGGTEGGLYKSTRSMEYIENKDLFGKLFLIKDSLQKWDWKITAETKEIGTYTCYKATTTKTTKTKKKVMEDGKEKEIEKISITEITAWYTPQIPVSQGPAEYWGLPGFILEVNDGKLNILCSQIILNPEEKIEIGAPSKGKKTDETTFKELYNEKVQEMLKMYDTKRKKAKSK